MTSVLRPVHQALLNVFKVVQRQKAPTVINTRAERRVTPPVPSIGCDRRTAKAGIRRCFVASAVLSDRAAFLVGKAQRLRVAPYRFGVIALGLLPLLVGGYVGDHLPLVLSPQVQTGADASKSDQDAHENQDLSHPTSLFFLASKSHANGCELVSQSVATGVA